MEPVFPKAQLSLSIGVWLSSSVNVHPLFSSKYKR